jgi:Ubiquitin carboxyl-terminal hydrolase
VNGTHKATHDDGESIETKEADGSETNGQAADGAENGTDESSTNGIDIISTDWPRIFMRPPGLRNYSNTCYMNSTLQALMHVAPLVSFLLSGDHGSICLVPSCLVDW